MPCPFKEITGTYIANDKIFWRLLFADPHVANVSERMCKAIKIKIIVNVKFILTFAIIIGRNVQPK